MAGADKQRYIMQGFGVGKDLGEPSVIIVVESHTVFQFRQAVMVGIIQEGLRFQRVGM